MGVFCLLLVVTADYCSLMLVPTFSYLVVTAGYYCLLPGGYWCLLFVTGGYCLLSLVLLAPTFSMNAFNIKN